jgi:hypothetical protein
MMKTLTLDELTIVCGGTGPRRNKYDGRPNGDFYSPKWIPGKPFTDAPPRCIKKSTEPNLWGKVGGYERIC